MKTVHIYAYSNHTEGGKALAVHMQREGILGGPKMIRHEGSTYKGGPGKTVINWGSSSIPDFVRPSRILNEPSAVNTAANKLLFFRHASSDGPDRPRVPEWTQDKALVQAWLAGENNRGVFARTELRGNSGAGIVDIREDADLNSLPDGTLFVKYIPKKLEWRIHMDRTGQAFAIQRKARRVDSDETLSPVSTNWRIRNLKNGFIFERNGDTRPDPDVIEQARRAIVSLGLDFGAVDVIWNTKSGAYVLEVNTAPGLEGTTVVDYSNMLYRLLSE